MARKFGKKTVVKIDPLAYNLGLFALSGWGKTSMMIEVCEKLAGEGGYIHLNMFREKGVDTINGAISEDVKSWGDYKEIIEDMIENKNEDYKDLRVTIIDTIDELAVLAEKEVIRKNNLKNPTKKTDTLNASFGGFGAGGNMVSEMILQSFDDLNEVGIKVIIVGHTKRRTKLDVVTGEEYDVITSKITDKLFTDIKTKLDVLGIGIVRRDISSNIVGKDIMGKDRVQKVAKISERIVTFRSEGDVIDSKSRFAHIEPEISFGSDVFIETINKAIKASFNERKQDTLTFDQAKKQQAKESKEKVDAKVSEIKKEVEHKNTYGTKEEAIDTLKTFYLETATDEQKALIKAKLKDNGIGKFDDLIDRNYEEIIEIMELTK